MQATLVLALGVLFGYFLKLFLFTKYLTPKEIGLLGVLLDAANIFAAFIPLGSQAIFVRYLPFFKGDHNKTPKGLLFLGTILTGIGFLVFILLFLFFRDALTNFYNQQAPLFANYIYFLIPLVLARVIFSVGQGYARALKKNIFPLFIKEILVRALTGILVIAFASHSFDLDGLVLWYVIIYFISGSVMTLYLSNNKLLDFSTNLTKLKNGKGKEILYFGLFAILSNTGDILMRNIDTLMLTSIKGLASAGIYSIAFFIGQIIELPRRAITQITAPFISEASEKNNLSQIASLYQKSSINQFLIGSILLICIWLNIDNILEIIPNGKNYAEGKYVVLFIGLGKLFDMSMGVNGLIIQQSKYYRFNFYSMGLLGLLGVTTNLILIPYLGIVGASVASLISVSLINVVRSIYVSSKFNLQPFSKASVIGILIVLVVTAICYFLPKVSNPVVDLVYRSSIAILLHFTLIIQLKISEDISALKNIVIKKVLKIFKG